nr:MAG TPA: hypothetical protein [Bacteriophage sp.]
MQGSALYVEKNSLHLQHLERGHAVKNVKR